MRATNEIKAVITGGASGLGYATAKSIVEAGGKVTLLNLHKEAGESAQASLGTNALFVETDVGSEEQVDNAIAQACEHSGEINLVVNCAGIAPSKRVLGRDGLMPISDFESVISTNLNGTFTVIRAAVNKMQNNSPDADDQRGVIVNTASIAAFDGLIGQAAYSASKGGISSMTLPLAREFARIGIRVMCIAPGLFRTPMFDTLPEKAVTALESATPFPSRLGNPDEFAAMVCHIYQNTMLNGETIRLDGALRMN